MFVVKLGFTGTEAARTGPDMPSVNNVDTATVATDTTMPVLPKKRFFRSMLSLLKSERATFRDAFLTLTTRAQPMDMSGLRNGKELSNCFCGRPFCPTDMAGEIAIPS
jgi:hypothetical protein